MNTDLHINDAYPPKEIARKTEAIGEAKAKTNTLTLLVLAILAGAFIYMGALFYTVVVTGNDSLGYGLTRLFGGLSFSLGLILLS
ncbi:MAG: formate transporter [Oceanospirillaceae bacterium]|jgi:formate transporter